MGWAAQREASSTLVTGKSQTSMIHAGAPRRCLPALELWLERPGRSRSATKAVFRNSCRMSIEVPKSRRNQGNGVNYSASCHTIRRTEKSQAASTIAVAPSKMAGTPRARTPPMRMFEARRMRAGSIRSRGIWAGAPGRSANPRRYARLKRSALPTTDTEPKLMAAVMIGLSAFGILLSPMMAAAAMSFSSVSVIGNALRRAQLVTGVACQRSKDVTVRLETHPRSLCRRQVLSVWSLTPEVEEKARGDSSPRAVSHCAN